MTSGEEPADLIRDSGDPRLDPYRGVRDRMLRADQGRFLVEAPRVIERFLGAAATGRFDVVALVATPEVAERLEHCPRPDDLPLHLATEEALTEASGYRFHAGALAVGRRPTRLPNLEDLIRGLPTGGTVVLGAAAGITSMDNMGGLFRSAAGLGVDGLLLDADCVDPLLRRCLRISMGQVFRVPWAVVDSLETAFRALEDHAGVRSVALENLPDAPTIDESPLPPRCVLVIGNEGHGLRRPILEACEQVRRIAGPATLPESERPGGEDERSLNAHVAASIAFHEARRRTGKD